MNNVAEHVKLCDTTVLQGESKLMQRTGKNLITLLTKKSNSTSYSTIPKTVPSTFSVSILSWKNCILKFMSVVF